MKAIVCAKHATPGVLKEVEKPSPGDKEVLVRINAATATPSDLLTTASSLFITKLLSGKVKKGHAIPGVEFAGIVEAMGKDVTRFKAGDRVFGSAGIQYGAYAEFICVPEDGELALTPGNLDDVEAASLCDGGLTALNFMKDKAGVKGGQKVLINGASGGVGTYAVQLARYFGAEVTGVCSAANAEMVRSLGANEVIDYAKEDFTANGRTYDVIFDAIGKSSFSRCKGSLMEKGVYLTTVPTPSAVIQALLTSVGSGRKAIFSATGLKKNSEKLVGMRFLADLAGSGKIKTVIDRLYPLDQIAEAHRYVGMGHKKGNVIITV